MRSHEELYHKHGRDEFSLVDIKQIAMINGKNVVEQKNINFNGQKLYKVVGETGLLTIEELKQRFLN